jgi:hypothetical protein
MNRVVLVLGSFLIPVLLTAQVKVEWERTYSGPTVGIDIGYFVAADAGGNVYVAGLGSGPSNDIDMLVIKYKPNGDTAWVRLFNGPAGGDDYVNGMVIDDFGNVYVTGSSKGPNPQWTRIDQITTLKYAPDGTLLWASRPLVEGSDGYAITLDKSGNVYTTGDVYRGQPPQRDVLTIKYLPNGDTAWVQMFDYQTFHGIEKPQYDWGEAIAVDGAGSVFVGGSTDSDTSSGINFDYLIMSYSSEGALQMAFNANGSANNDDKVHAMRIDAAGNLALTGYSKGKGSDYDYWTWMFPSDGPSWDRRYNGTAGSDDWGYDLAIDGDGNVIVVGRSWGIDTGYDYAIVKYSKKSDSLWARRFNGLGNGDDRALKVAVDKHNNIYVTGLSWSDYTSYDYVTIKYTPAGEMEWVKMYTSTTEDWAQAICVDDADNVYVTGRSGTVGPKGTSDIMTIKYVQGGNFKPDPDGWRFRNWLQEMWPPEWWIQFDYSQPPYPFAWTMWPINARPSDFPDWPLFVDAFGIDQCYFRYSTTGDMIYRPTAIVKWRSIVNNPWGGACFGFTTSSLLYYKNLLILNELFPVFSTVYAVPLSDESRKLVQKYHVYEYGAEHTTYLRDKKSYATVGLTFAELKQMLASGGRTNRTLGLLNTTGIGGHSVVPCSLAHDEVVPQFYDLHIYDPNYPGSDEVITIDTVEGTWYYNRHPSWGGDYGFFLMDSIQTYAQIPQLSLAVGLPQSLTRAVKTAASGFVEVYTSSLGSTRISGETGGVIGYNASDSTLIDSMANASPIIPLTGTEQPPIGYIVPQGDYVVQLSNHLDSSLYLRTFTDSSFLACEQRNPSPGEVSRITLGNAGRSMQIENRSPDPTTTVLECIDVQVNRELVCELVDLQLPPSGLLQMQMMGGKRVQVTNAGSSLSYTLRLERANQDVDSKFQHSGIVIAGHSAHVIDPAWEELNSTPVSILVDGNLDGTYDDTLTMSNEISQVRDPLRDGGTPTEFSLAQNYPNPFNPITVISFQLPAVSDVRLSVYDILGREVAVLVNEKQGPGTHAVRFDASGLASGVYLYRLHARHDDGGQAGDYVASKKMVVLK